MDKNSKNKEICIKFIVEFINEFKLTSSKSKRRLL